MHQFLDTFLERIGCLMNTLDALQSSFELNLAFADLRLDLGTREVTRDGKRIALTRTEFALLQTFMENPRRVLERSWLLNEVWGFEFPTTANSLEVYIGYLRRKTESEGEPRLIHTVRGIGYVLRETAP